MPWEAKVVTPAATRTVTLTQVERGAPGESAYALAVRRGFEGTEAEWLASLGDEVQVAAAIEAGIDQALIDERLLSADRAAEAFPGYLTWRDLSADTTAAFGECLNVNTNTADVTVTLPPAVKEGAIVRVRNTGKGVVTVLPPAEGGNNIDGLPSAQVNGYNAVQEYVSNGLNRWRSGPALIPQVHVKDQIGTQHDAAGGNRNYALVIANQVTTGSAPDGVHDLVFVVGNNPAIGDADIYFVRGDDNEVGVVFMHMPIKYEREPLEIRDANNIPMFRFALTSGDVELGGRLVGNNGANRHLTLRSGGPSAEVRIQKADGAPRFTYAEATDAFTVGAGASWNFAVAAGTAAGFTTDATNRLNLRGAPGGLRFLNNAFSAANLTLSDNGDITPRDGANIVLSTGTGMKLGTTATQKLGFYGAPPVTRRPSSADATDLASVIALANAVKADLVTLGLKA